ncbi:MAG: uncharacterized protein KVP18_004121 [Porospora cf. gigantea A]|uniref:uncharacterized protein n=2 Tax=Porospora cf. gigantea A TaxID=2853593 RepID=UPI00355961D0|nr:MAG: hypothetical protein KVP18_004121 [Porospora cf. gigantea A]
MASPRQRFESLRREAETWMPFLRQMHFEKEVPVLASTDEPQVRSWLNAAEIFFKKHAVPPRLRPFLIESRAEAEAGASWSQLVRDGAKNSELLWSSTKHLFLEQHTHDDRWGLSSLLSGSSIRSNVDLVPDKIRCCTKCCIRCCSLGCYMLTGCVRWCCCE